MIVTASLWAPKETCSTGRGWLVHRSGDCCLCCNFGHWYRVMVGGELLPQTCSAPQS